MEPFWIPFGWALVVAMVPMTLLWLISIPLRNASIVDIFWGPGFLLLAAFYATRTDGIGWRETLLLVLVGIWSLRLGGYLAWRNLGKGEDPRYRKFRADFGAHRYWWYSFFQVFLLQGILMVVISAPLLGAMRGDRAELGVLDGIAVAVWGVGLLFEAGSDWQLARFKANPENRGKLLTSGFWRYTRHPNYFGDAAVWWGYGLLAISAGSPWSALGSVAMTLLIIQVSGVALLEKTLRVDKPGYEDYLARTSAFFPWFPKSSEAGGS